MMFGTASITIKPGTYNNATGYANVIVEPAFITSHDFQRLAGAILGIQ